MRVYMHMYKYIYTYIPMYKKIVFPPLPHLSRLSQRAKPLHALVCVSLCAVVSARISIWHGHSLAELSRRRDISAHNIRSVGIFQYNIFSQCPQKETRLAPLLSKLCPCPSTPKEVFFACLSKYDCKKASSSSADDLNLVSSSLA